MRNFIKILIITVSLITLKGCSESRVLEENTKEVRLSNYKVSYKYLNNDFFEEGSLFEPLYFKGDEIYGLVTAYPKNGLVEDYPTTQYKIDSLGNFKEYKNESLEEYRNDSQLRNISQVRNGNQEKSDLINNTIYTKKNYIKDITMKKLYIEDINYYYSDFANNSLKELEWLKEPMKNIVEIKDQFKGGYEESYGNEDLIIYEYNSNPSKDLIEDEETEKSYKLIYMIDLKSKRIYVSDLIEEDKSMLYYYNYDIEAFIKVDKDGTFKKIDINQDRIYINEYSSDYINDYLEGSNNLFENIKSAALNNILLLKDYSVIKNINRETVNSETIIIRNKDGKINNHIQKEYKDKDYINVLHPIENSNYMLTENTDKYYIGIINEDLEIELIKEIELKNHISSERNKGADISMFSNGEGNKALITIKHFNIDKDYIYAFDNIEYIYLEIEERD